MLTDASSSVGNAFPRVSADALRVVAAVAVVLIHGSGRYEWLLVNGHSWRTLPVIAAMVSQIARFCVPVFIILSGYALARSWSQAAVIGRRRDYWLRRAVRLLPPALLFNAVGLIFSHGGRPFGAAPLTDVGHHLMLVGQATLIGDGDYPLYYLSIVGQLVILIPLLHRIGGVAVGLLFLVQAALAWPGSSLISTHLGLIVHLPAWCVINWLGYAALGCWLARAPQTTPLPGPRWRWGAAVVTALALVAVCVEYLQAVSRLPHPGSINHFNRWTVIVAGTSCFLTWWLWTRRPGHRLEQMARLAPVTFGVYLIHAWVFRLLDVCHLPPWWPLDILLVLVSVFALMLAIHRWMPLRFLRICLGLPERRPSQAEWSGPL